MKILNKTESGILIICVISTDNEQTHWNIVWYIHNLCDLNANEHTQQNRDWCIHNLCDSLC